MKAILVRQPGGPEQLYVGEAATPVPAADELLVRVGATALNRADTLQRQGKYPPPPGASEILGLEMAGVVERVGAAVEGWQPGDRAMALLAGGGYAEYVAVPADQAMRVPERLSLEEAAALPEVFLTAFQALDWLGGLTAGQHVLIHAGASGVGTAAIQLAKAAGAAVYVTASAPKHALCLALGADAAIDYRSEDFAARVRDLSGGHGADLIIDFIGAPYLEPNVRCLAVDGRIVVLATLGGSVAAEFDIRSLFRKRGHLLTSTLRSRSAAYKARLTADVAERLLPRFADGTLRPVIDLVLPWTEVAEGHRRMEANANAGKIVLRVGNA